MRIRYEFDGEYKIELEKGACSSTQAWVSRYQVPFFRTPDFTGGHDADAVKPHIIDIRKSVMEIVSPKGYNAPSVWCQIQSACGSREFRAVPHIDSEGIITLNQVQDAEYTGAFNAIGGGEGWVRVGTEEFTGAIYSSLGVFDSMREYETARYEAEL